jgi:hypothetical protein
VIDVAVVREQLAGVVHALEPDAVPLPEVVSLWDAFDAVERHAAAAKTLLARRVDDSRMWQRAGHRSAAEFLAAKSGSSIGAARTQLNVSREINKLPATEQALRDGDISAAQAAAIVDGASANPAAEQQLIECSRRASLAELRAAALRARAAADPDRETTHRRIHKRRRLRWWTDAEGAWNLSARGTVADGARVAGVLEPLIDKQFTTARRENRREDRDAYAFDALVGLAEEAVTPAVTMKRPHPRYFALLRVDLAALQRGEVLDDEYCEITGLGPIPVATARALLGDSILKLVITKGVDVLNVTHLGRGPNTAQRIALLWSSPGCTVEGCARTRVEIDHRIPYSTTRHTRLDECDPLCSAHHNLKHHDGWALVAGRGKRAMVPVGDPRHPKNRPRDAQ